MSRGSDVMHHLILRSDTGRMGDVPDFVSCAVLHFVFHVSMNSSADLLIERSTVNKLPTIQPRSQDGRAAQGKNKRTDAPRKQAACKAAVPYSCAPCLQRCLPPLQPGYSPAPHKGELTRTRFRNKTGSDVVGFVLDTTRSIRISGGETGRNS